LQIVCIGEGEIMSGENTLDPRVRLVREKYFSLRPKPLERWLWAQRISPTAERVFWLHWQEGMQRGDWCSELPLSRVARECCVDLSTVTKAYQRLTQIGCLRRTDPGRDPANPFQQATAITEVRIPRDLLAQLERHPNRRTQSSEKSEKYVRTISELPIPEPQQSITPKAVDPFAGLNGRERLRALSQLTSAMSAAELARYRDAQRNQIGHMSFDEGSKLSLADQGRVAQFLAILATSPTGATPSHATCSAPPKGPVPQKLSVFELARLKRAMQTMGCGPSTPELLRQVIWSIEEGPLKRFAHSHAIHIALKKIREQAWTRPNRMPPNWVRDLSTPAVHETCRSA
jgi:hypothetical protein